MKALLSTGAHLCTCERFAFGQMARSMMPEQAEGGSFPKARPSSSGRVTFHSHRNDTETLCCSMSLPAFGLTNVSVLSILTYVNICVIYIHIYKIQIVNPQGRAMLDTPGSFPICISSLVMCLFRLFVLFSSKIPVFLFISFNF